MSTSSVAAISLERFALDAGEGFATHVHDVHQLAWVREGVLMVRIGERSWMLPPALALWIPAGTPHSSTAVRAAMRRVAATNASPSGTASSNPPTSVLCAISPASTLTTTG